MLTPLVTAGSSRQHGGIVDAVHRAASGQTLLRRGVYAVAVLLFFNGPLAAQSQAVPTDEADFFEARIRPVLIARCGKCHGEEKQWAGLRLDSREAILKGGDSGPAIVLGNSRESLLIAAVGQSGDLQMPPKGKLPPEQIAALKRWVNMGAPWPKSSAMANDVRAEARQQHWAFQPVKRPELPEVRCGAWCGTPIDRFVLSRLEGAGLEPSPEADRRTLIRRASYDLTGLPPDPAEVDAFIADRDPDAYARQIDRLLDSPHYGEHWARHWLDVARFADTKGYVYAREERFFVHSAAYRDWVIDAFNRDLPYDRFLQLQIAADQVAPEDRSALAAMGFLTLGQRFLGVSHDIIDDRIDVVSRGLMGLTVGCARCHDHKYDPIPTSDYYSLYGVFQNCTERIVPLAPPPGDDTGADTFSREFQTRQQKLRDEVSRRREEAAKRVRQLVTAYLLAQRELYKYPDEGFDQILDKDELIPAFVRKWRWYLSQADKSNDPVFVPWLRFSKVRDDEFSRLAEGITRELNIAGGPQINPFVAQAFATTPASLQEVAQRYGELFARVEKQWEELLSATDESGGAQPLQLPDLDAEQLRQVLFGAHSPCVVPDEAIVGTDQYFDNKTIESLWKLQAQFERWLLSVPHGTACAVALVDRDWLREPRIFRRGVPATPGDEVPRQFLGVIAGPDRRPFSHGSGRLELAQAIGSRDNPLTARVWVNRVWLHHFGEGLVRTPSDFGTRAEAPSHPELLDWLAAQLIDDGWSTKALHRRIMLSATYRQSSMGPPDRAIRQQTQQIDPENRLLWRMNARRASFEEMRDSLLAAAGELDEGRGGRPGELFSYTDSNRRRTVYGLIDRNFLPGAMRTFDFANPEMHSPQRNETTVPQQALFALNHPFVANRARGLASRAAAAATDDLEGRLRWVYRAIYQRDPTVGERRQALAFLSEAARLSATESLPTAVRPESLTWRCGYGEIDVSAGRLQSFQPLAFFSGSAWQGGEKLPDLALGRLQITSSGGRAGDDLQHASVRRWRAPRVCVVDVDSRIEHEPDGGDGVRGWIVSSRHGTLKSAVVHKGKTRLDIEGLAFQTGDVLDFVVDCNGNRDDDTYRWAPVIRERSASRENPVDDRPLAIWDAAQDFSGPVTRVLDPWAQFVQVLLVANEMMLVD